MANILLVDDDQFIRVHLGKVLESAGYVVTYATDGEAGLRAFDEGQFDLVITDLEMPKSNGLRLIREIRDIEPDIAVIAVSGKSPEHLLLAQDYGATKVLAKPIKAERILYAVQAALAREVSTPRF